MEAKRDFASALYSSRAGFQVSGFSYIVLRFPLIPMLASQAYNEEKRSMRAINAESAPGPVGIVNEKAFSTIGHITLAAWAIDGFQNLVLRGLSVSSVLLPVGLLLAYSAGCLGPAMRKFKFE